MLIISSYIRSLSLSLSHTHTHTHIVYTKGVRQSFAKCLLSRTGSQCPGKSMQVLPFLILLYFFLHFQISTLCTSLHAYNVQCSTGTLCSLIHHRSCHQVQAASGRRDTRQKERYKSFTQLEIKYNIVYTCTFVYAGYNIFVIFAMILCMLWFKVLSSWSKDIM